MSNNFSTILWNKFFTSLTKDFGIPTDAGMAFLQQTFKQIRVAPTTALTGPLVRNDKNTLTANLNALKDDPFRHVYRAFIKTFAEEKGKSLDEYSNLC